jgi:hypothetical protein
VSRTKTRPVRAAVVATLLALVAGVAAAGPVPAETGAEASPVLKADYRFQNTLASSVSGARRLVNIRPSGNPPNTFVPFSGGGRALAFPEGNGLRLDRTGQIIRRGHYTIAIRMEFDQVVDYARVINFKGDSDYGLYVRGQDLRLYDTAEGDNDLIDPNEWMTVVLTRNGSTGQVRAYLDGVLQFSVADPGGRAVISSANVLRFFRDDANREESAGTVRRIRIWNGPLSASRVAAL